MENEVRMSLLRDFLVTSLHHPLQSDTMDILHKRQHRTRLDILSNKGMSFRQGETTGGIAISRLRSNDLRNVSSYSALILASIRC